jgi:hypothetical protein
VDPVKFTRRTAGWAISSSTTFRASSGSFERWARTRPEQYEEVVREILPRVNEVVAADCISVARLAADAEVETLKRYHEVLPQLPARDVPGALRNVSTTKGINIQRARELRGEPTVIRHEKQSATELWAEYTAMFPSVVGGEAIEIPAEIQAPDQGFPCTRSPVNAPVSGVADGTRAQISRQGEGPTPAAPRL